MNAQCVVVACWTKAGGSDEERLQLGIVSILLLLSRRLLQLEELLPLKLQKVSYLAVPLGIPGYDGSWLVPAH